jgi:hypothetical protein
MKTIEYRCDIIMAASALQGKALREMGWPFHLGDDDRIHKNRSELFLHLACQSSLRKLD